MQILEKLFGSGARVKMLRFFLLSPERVFTPKEAARVLKISFVAVSKEVKFLTGIGFIKKAQRIDEIAKKSRKKIKILKKNVRGFGLSPTFPFALSLRNLLVNASPVSREKMTKFFKSRGKIKLVALGGIFARDLDSGEPNDFSRLDLLIVGEAKRSQVADFVAKLESEIGKELNWTLLSRLEFEHRLSMHDRLLRDLFDYPHEFLINKLGVE